QRRDHRRPDRRGPAWKRAGGRRNSYSYLLPPAPGSAKPTPDRGPQTPRQPGAPAFAAWPDRGAAMPWSCVDPTRPDSPQVPLVQTVREPPDCTRRRPEPASLTTNSPGEAIALYPTTLEAQIDQSHHDPLRVLVVGAGIAGLTAAQLLRRAGLHPIVVERAGPEADDGYMLALMPMVEAALRDLDVWEPYRNASTALHRFRLRSRTGAVLRTDSMTSMLQRYGDYRGISRGRLMEVLTHAGAPVTFGTTVRALHESSD